MNAEEVIKSLSSKMDLPSIREGLDEIFRGYFLNTPPDATKEDKLLAFDSFNTLKEHLFNIEKAK